MMKTPQAIAILDSRDRQQAALDQAQEQVRVAEANLAKVKAGAKNGEIQAQKATLARIRADLRNEITAQQSLREEKSIAAP
jgi:HlyD family secretion protein